MAAVGMRVCPSFVRLQICGWRLPKRVVGVLSLAPLNASSSSAASHSRRLHSVVLALWQQLGCVCARALCVPKFAVGGCPRELWASFRRIFCTIQMQAAPAMPAILLASIASFSRWQQLGCVCARAFCVPKNVRRRQKEDWDRQDTEQQVCAQFS